MRTINDEKFFEEYRRAFGKLTQKQVDGLNFLLPKLINSSLINTIPKQAYTLATIGWETGHTFQPITEYGSQKYLRSKPYWPYIGRGYVQLTWSTNYLVFGKRLNLPLYDKPELANDPEVAWEVLEEGMTDLTPQDPEFTGKSLEDYFDNGKCDYHNARRIINPKDWDSYTPIANAAKAYEYILTASVTESEQAAAQDGVNVNVSEDKPDNG